MGEGPLKCYSLGITTHLNSALFKDTAAEFYHDKTHNCVSQNKSDIQFKNSGTLFRRNCIIKHRIRFKEEWVFLNNSFLLLDRIADS
jgi:hypothetical protein